MTNEIIPPTGTTTPTQLTASVHDFAMRFSSAPRGARLARHLAAQRLDAWGLPYDSDIHDTLTLIVAELSANAVRHGHVPGRDFHLCLASDATWVRIEVSDTRTERLPATPSLAASDDTWAEAGRGLLLVARLTTRWGWMPRPDGPGKTVWAELHLGGAPAHF